MVYKIRCVENEEQLKAVLLVDIRVLNFNL